MLPLGEGEKNEEKSLMSSVAEVVERLGYECVHVGMKTDSVRLRLQVLIDSMGGINVQDCETVSRAVNRLLDERDFTELSGRYYLEVSSPGLERPLFTPGQYGRFRGQEARIRLSSPVAGRKTLTGAIVEATEERVVLFVEDEEREIAVPFQWIKSGNLVYRGLEQEAPRGKKKGAKPPVEHRGREL